MASVTASTGSRRLMQIGGSDAARMSGLSDDSVKKCERAASPDVRKWVHHEEHEVTKQSVSGGSEPDEKAASSMVSYASAWVKLSLRVLRALRGAALVGAS